MTSSNPRRLMLGLAILFFPVLAFAQEATVSGTVVDSTGGVLPGVTVTAVSATTGNTFLGVTDERGTFRVPVRVGQYKITMELPGFATVAQEFEALVGQIVTVNAQMKPSTVQESVTVTGEAPLIETTSSTLAGNIDPRQTKDLPVNGGNWLDLSLLAPGNRSNGVDPNTPTARQRFDFQLNIDGQQVTNNGRAGAGIRACRRKQSASSSSWQAGGTRPRDGQRRAGERGDEVGDEHIGRQLHREFPKQPVQRRRFRPETGAPL